MLKKRGAMLVALFVVLSSFIAADGVFAQGSWTFAARMSAHPGRAGLAAATGLDGTIYAIGGTTIGDPNVIRTVEAYNPSTDTWIIKSPMPTARTSLAAATGFDGRIYAIGGCPESHGYYGLNTVEVYDPGTDTWSTVAPMPTARTGLAAVTGPDGRIYAIGGYNLGVGHFNTVEAYDPNTYSWATVAPMPTARQWLGAALGLDGRIYAVGGTNQWRSGLLDTVEAYDPASDTWTTVAPMPRARDGVGAATGSDGRIYAVGGYRRLDVPFPPGDVTRVVEAYDPVTNSWTAVASLLTDEYGPATVTGADGRIYAIGGGYGVSSLVEVYTPSDLAPTVTLTNPIDGTIFAAPATATIRALATTRADRRIERVEFYAGETLIGTATSAPYQMTGSTHVPGTYVLRARAVDNTGASTISAAVTVTVR